MRWFWHRRITEDEQALEQARESLRRTRARWPMVNHAAQEMDRHRRANNFTHKIRVAMGVEKP